MSKGHRPSGRQPFKWMHSIHHWISAVWKVVATVLHIISGVLTVVFVFPKLPPLQQEERIQYWAQDLLAKMGVQWVVHGKPPEQCPMLLVSNHITWLDIIVLLATTRCQFVSKSDVRRWPLIGTLADRAGTLFVERASRRDAMRVVHKMVERLRLGHVLALFPEGTTSNGISVLPFHANLFQAAISANIPVLPAAISFLDVACGQRSQAPCYTQDDTLYGSIWRTLNAPPLCAVLTFGDLQWAQGRDRRAWALDLQMAVKELLGYLPSKPVVPPKDVRR